jgi:hypothetical protein
VRQVRPSLEESIHIQTRIVALDYIGKRGPTQGVTQQKRIEYAKQCLQRELLPHVGIQVPLPTEPHSQHGITLRYVHHPRIGVCA